MRVIRYHFQSLDAILRYTPISPANGTKSSSRSLTPPMRIAQIAKLISPCSRKRDKTHREFHIFKKSSLTLNTDESIALAYGTVRYRDYNFFFGIAHTAASLAADDIDC